MKRFFLKQESRLIEEFVQEFKRIARDSSYEEHLLIEEFKWSINRAIRRKLIETKMQPSSIEQWFKRTIILDYN